MPNPEPDWLLRHAYAIEGHPDNVAAAIFGGFVLAYEGRDGITVASSPVAASVGAAVFVPEQRWTTSAPREDSCPRLVLHVDAAANSGRSALLVYALAHDPDRLYDATRDWLHQNYREPAMPRSYELMKALREREFAAVISGAGPSVLVLGRAAELIRLEAIRRSRIRAPTQRDGRRGHGGRGECRNARRKAWTESCDPKLPFRSGFRHALV